MLEKYKTHIYKDFYIKYIFNYILLEVKHICNYLNVMIACMHEMLLPRKIIKECALIHYLLV